MCRVIGWIGEPRALEAFTTRPPHGLLHQSYAPREQEAKVNADGWGAAGWLADDPRPVVYVSTGPIWSDPNLPHQGRLFRGRSLLAAVRSATDPLSVSAANTQPFHDGRVAFLHNGFLDGFREAVMEPLRARLLPPLRATVRGGADSEHVFALVRQELEAGAPLSVAVARAAEIAREVTVAAGRAAYLTLLAGDGEELVAVRLSSERKPPTLYVREESGGVVFASEPLDDGGGFRALEPGVVHVAGPRGLREVGT